MKALVVFALLLLAACAGTETLNSSDTLNSTGATNTTANASETSEHGIVPSEAPNLPYAEGMYEVEARAVQYHDGAQGYYARPADSSAYPGIILIHEWWGLNDNMRATAEQYAAQGYQVLAVDLFGKVATTPEQARELTGGFNQAEGLENMRAALNFLQEENVTAVASLGYCFGGGQSLQLGLAEDLDATVIYYGQLVTNTSALETIEQPVLGIFGENDTSIPPARVEEFNASLAEAGVEKQIYIYPDAAHAFANPSGDRYNAAAAQDAWEKTMAFLATLE